MKRDCPLPSGATTWAYFRDAGGEAQEGSVGQQLDVAREYAARHGLHLTAALTDAATDLAELLAAGGLYHA